MKQEVLDFIKKRFNNDCNWTTGNCLYFAAILVLRFPDAEIYYLPIEGHFITKIENDFYDWNGVVFPTENPILFEEIKNNDPLLYKRLIRDCLL